MIFFQHLNIRIVRQAVFADRREICRSRLVRKNLEESSETRPTCCFPTRAIKILLYLRWHDLERKVLTVCQLTDAVGSGAVENDVE